jgi:predicted transposase YdaD
MPFDNTCKYLSETYPDSFVTWLFGTAPESIEVLKREYRKKLQAHQKRSSLT